MQRVQAKQVLGYMVLPGIVPRAKNLFASGFGYLAFLMASIYGIVRLLPANHPYLDPRNIGKFGIRHVIAEAANNLVLSRKNIDQIIIFTALLAGIVILVMQLVLLAYGYIIQPVLAQSIFVTAAPERDIAFMMLDRVFGIPDLFNSCVDEGTVCKYVPPGQTPPPAEPGGLPHPFHLGLHSLFRFYSLGLLVVGTLIFLYFVVIVIGETAVTGTPFGQRFQNVWVPIRLVVALGLLVPINYGLNAGQYITLYSAKIGSSFATNGWLVFNDTLNNPLGEDGNLIAKPNAPAISELTSFMALAHACAYAYWHMDTDTNFTGKPVSGGNVQYYQQPYGGGFHDVGAFLIRPSDSPAQDGHERLFAGTTYATALNFYDNTDIIIRFGKRNPVDPNYEKYSGNVEPTCGEIKISVHSLTTGTGGGTNGITEMQETYFNLIKELWFTGGPNNINLIQLSQRFMARSLPASQWGNFYVQCTICTGSTYLNCGPGITPGGPEPQCARDIPPNAIMKAINAHYTGEVEGYIIAAWAAVSNDPNIFGDANLITDGGWGGAGIWYNKISEINGAFSDAVLHLPAKVKYPILMEETREIKLSNDSKPSALKMFDPFFSDGKKIKLHDSTYAEDDAGSIAKSLNDYYIYMLKDDVNTFNEEKAVTGSFFKDIINFVFGTSGLMAIRGENADIHPLAQLTAVGKSLVDSAVISVLGATTGAIQILFEKLPGISGEGAAGFATQIAFLGLTAGFVLFYILPFLPFVYFFFAVGAWVKKYI